MRRTLSVASLRLPLAGGGTDVASYSDISGGFAIFASLRLYSAVCVTDIPGPGYSIDCLTRQDVTDIDQITHPIVKRAVEQYAGRRHCRIVSTSDIRPGTGLGSSGAFTVSLLGALRAHMSLSVSPRSLAEEASSLEMVALERPMGRQDQFAAALGGVRAFDFGADGIARERPLALSVEFLARLQSHLLLVDSGRVRSAGKFMREQDRRSRERDTEFVRNLDEVKRLAEDMYCALNAEDLESIPRLFNEHWALKRHRLRKGLGDLDRVFELGVKCGASGGKLVGAGGGGFFLFFAPNPERFEYELSSYGVSAMHVEVDKSGLRVWGPCDELPPSKLG